MFVTIHEGHSDGKGSGCSQARFYKNCQHLEAISDGVNPANACGKAPE